MAKYRVTCDGFAGKRFVRVREEQTTTAFDGVDVPRQWEPLDQGALDTLLALDEDYKEKRKHFADQHRSLKGSDLPGSRELPAGAAEAAKVAAVEAKKALAEKVKRIAAEKKVADKRDAEAAAAAKKEADRKIAERDEARKLARQ